MPRKGPNYAAPNAVSTASFQGLVGDARSVPEAQKARLKTGSMFPSEERSQSTITLYFAGDPTLLARKCVAVVGSRNVTEAGARRAGRLARELVAQNVVVVSGLAEGVDAAAHHAAIAAGGRTVAVIGTGLDRAYPAVNAELQELIWRNHLLVSPFAVGGQVYKSNFPHRNKVMAALSDATVVIEASDTSGSLHQAAECLRIGRWLFIPKSIAESSEVSWPSKFLDSARRGAKVRVLTSVRDVLEVLG